MTTYLPSSNIAAVPSEKPQRTVRIAAFDCEGLHVLSRELGFRVAVVAAVDDVELHARRLRDLWYASGVPRSWDTWCLPFDFDNWRYREWRAVRFDERWFGRTDHPLIASLDGGTLLLELPGGVSRATYATAFRDGLADLRFEAVVRRPAFLLRWHHSRRQGIPTSRYARASAVDATPTEVRDLVRLIPRDLPAIAAVALATWERLAGATQATASPVHGL